MKKITLFLFAFAATPLCKAQAVFNSLEDIWKYADGHSIAIQTAQYEVTKAAYAKKQSYSNALPQVTANGTFTDNINLQTTLIPAEIFGGTPGTYRTLQFGQQYVYTGNINAQVSILNLQNWFSIRIAKQTEELNKDSLATSRKSVYQQVANEYYSYLLMQEAARLADQTVGISDSVFELTDNKFKEGTLDETSVDIAKLNFERAQQSQITSYCQMAVAKNNLRALLGLSVNDSFHINAGLQGNTDNEVTGSFQEDPAIKLALQRAQISLSQYKQANKAFVPTINILYNYSTQRYDKVFEPFTNAKGSSKWFPAQYFALQASLPIFTGGSRLFQSRRNKIAYEESIALYDNTKKQSAVNDENIRLNYQKAVAVLGKAKDVMDLSFDNYTHISYRYEAGIARLEDRLNAFKDYIDYQNQYLNSLSDMLVQLYQIKIRQLSF